METEVMKTVLKELLEEQKESNLINGEIARYIESLTEQIGRLDKSVMAQQQSGNAEIVALIQTLQADFIRLKSELLGRPNIITQKKIFQLFPSFNIREYYQVYGNIIKWLSIFGCSWLLASLIREFLEKQGLIY